MRRIYGSLSHFCCSVFVFVFVFVFVVVVVVVVVVVLFSTTMLR